MRLRSRAKHRIRRKRLGRPFTRLWAGFTLASSGDGLAYGAVPLMAVFVDPRPLAVSTVVAADSLPWLLLALPAGAFADRFERGPLMAIANVLRALVILGGAFLIASNKMTLVLLILVVLVNAGARAIYYSSLQALVPDLVPSNAFESANGVLTATEAGTEHLAGPVVGTWLFTIGKAIPFFADAVALVLSCFPFMKFRSKAPRPEGASTSAWEGARLLFKDRRLRILLIMVGTLAGLQGMEAGVLVLLATTEWGVKEGAYGIFLAAGAAGNLLGSLGANRLVRRFGSAQTLIGAAVISGVGYLVMAVAQNWMLAGPAFAAVGYAVGAGSVIAISLRQRLTPDELMGRVGGAWRGLVWGAAPVGALAAGTLASIGGLRLPLVLAGILQCIVGVALARPLLQSLREATHPAS
ncbi:MAG TPA: MFS transporter [Acidimicrobiales bacterium]|jgi:MFS family permease|nr:MFS transporter [Acidimicrobiales bacterium]